MCVCVCGGGGLSMVGRKPGNETNVDCGGILVHSLFIYM